MSSDEEYHLLEDDEFGMEEEVKTQKDVSTDDTEGSSDIDDFTSENIDRSLNSTDNCAFPDNHTEDVCAIVDNRNSETAHTSSILPHPRHL